MYGTFVKHSGALEETLSAANKSFMAGGKLSAFDRSVYTYNEKTRTLAR